MGERDFAKPITDLLRDCKTVYQRQYDRHILEEVAGRCDSLLKSLAALSREADESTRNVLLAEARIANRLEDFNHERFGERFLVVHLFSKM